MKSIVSNISGLNFKRILDNHNPRGVSVEIKDSHVILWSDKSDLSITIVAKSYADIISISDESWKSSENNVIYQMELPFGSSISEGRFSTSSCAMRYHDKSLIREMATQICRELGVKYVHRS